MLGGNYTQSMNNFSANYVLYVMYSHTVIVAKCLTIVPVSVCMLDLSGSTQSLSAETMDESSIKAGSYTQLNSHSL